MHYGMIKGPSINICMCDWVPQKDDFNECFNHPPSCVHVCLTLCVFGLSLGRWRRREGRGGGGGGGGGGLAPANTNIHISKSGEEFGAGEQCSDLVLHVLSSVFRFAQHTPRSELLSLSLSLLFLALSLSRQAGSSSPLLSRVNIALTWCLACTLIFSLAAFRSLQASVDTPTHLPPPRLCY